MNGKKAFLDTNILIYLFSESEEAKRITAQNAIDRYDCITSLQALNEASNVWFKKSGWTGEQIREHLDNIEFICDDVVAVQRSTVDAALALKDRYRYSYYDCIMLASALESHCHVILTEDMKDEHLILGKLLIINPFK
jgi:predicted nucleic acid-binding protein